MNDYFICPNCGAEVPDNALACPECGSDEETGWSAETVYDGLYLYDDEPLSAPRPAQSWIKPITTGLLILIVMAVLSAMLGRTGVYLALILAALGGVFYYMTQMRPLDPARREQALYYDLRRKARGDEALVERLIAYEQRRNPRASRQQWLQDAIDRWERDNR